MSFIKSFSFGTISKLFLVLGTFFMAYWPQIYINGSISPWRFELIFGIAVLFFIADMVSQRYQKSFPTDLKEKSLMRAVGLLIGSIALGTLIGYFVYDLTLTFVGITSVVKILLGIMTFAAVFYYSRNSSGFYKKLAWAFTIPTLLLIPFFLFPTFAETLGLISSGYRFQGLTVNPLLFGSLATISFSFLYSLMFNELSTKETPRIQTIILYALGLMGIGGLIFWSQSRSYIIALYLVIFITAFLYTLSRKINFRKAALYSFVAMMLISVSFFLAPAVSRNTFIKVRLFGANHSEVVTAVQRHVPRGAFDFSLHKAFTIIREDPRISMWNYFAPLFPKYPLGWGVDYQSKFAYPWHDHENITFLPPVFIMNIWALGGIGAVISILYLFRRAYVVFKNRILDKENTLSPLVMGTFTTLIIFVFASLFNGLQIEYLSFWIILALAM